MKLILLIYFFFILPSILLLIYFNHRFNQLEKWQGVADRLVMRMVCMQKGREDHYQVIESFENRRDDSIDDILESMVFLKSEVEALKLMDSHPLFAPCQNLQYRLDQLTAGSNQLGFVQGSREVKNRMEEVELSQHYPVEIDIDDLKMILSVVEGASSIKNQRCIIKGFRLDRKKLAERETYFLEMELIKRGYLK